MSPVRELKQSLRGDLSVIWLLSVIFLILWPVNAWADVITRYTIHRNFNPSRSQKRKYKVMWWLLRIISTVIRRHHLAYIFGYINCRYRSRHGAIHHCIFHGLWSLAWIINAEWRIYAPVKHDSIGSDNGLSPAGAKPLSEPIAKYCLFDPWEQTLVKSYSKYLYFH